MLRQTLSKAMSYNVPMRMCLSGNLGDGAGRGGGGGGSIRESGGASGKREAAFEEQYFRRIQSEQLKHLKELHENEIEFHQKEIARHQAAIDRHLGRISKIDPEEKK